MPGSTDCPQIILERAAVPAVVVSHYGGPYPGLLSAELVRNATLQIALPCVRHALERPGKRRDSRPSKSTRIDSSLTEQDESVHSGSAPLKSRYLHSATGRSPSAYRSHSSLLSDARRSLWRPSVLAVVLRPCGESAPGARPRALPWISRLRQQVLQRVVDAGGVEIRFALERLP